MTDPEILTLVKEHFEVGGIRDDGSSSEYYGTPDDFLKFALVMYNKGQEEEIRRQKTGIGYVNGVLTLDEF